MSHSSHKVKGVNLSTGFGTWITSSNRNALANNILKKEKVFVLLHGELNEGSNWESILFASHHRLNNLVIIVDYNKIQSLDFVKKTINLEPIKKFDAFGYDVVSINGHNFKQINNSKKKTNKPLVIIANTIKGKGISFMENKVLWHYKPPNKFELKSSKRIRKLNEKFIY